MVASFGENYSLEQRVSFEQGDFIDLSAIPVDVGDVVCVSSVCEARQRLGAGTISIKTFCHQERFFIARS